METADADERFTYKCAVMLHGFTFLNGYVNRFCWLPLMTAGGAGSKVALNEHKCNTSIGRRAGAVGLARAHDELLIGVEQTFCILLELLKSEDSLLRLLLECAVARYAYL
ncbi:hypothetical protein TTRE_0000073401 [Trichuris trichiura]|uniref:Uncharacterized protein n=1 Tax=Trichuris trichiura TaxID=36087 RepID=A0A077YWP6_TRITR|nr:hypothetical protein TTRE_0000073401 [Trichuris trichiura]